MFVFCYPRGREIECFFLPLSGDVNFREIIRDLTFSHRIWGHKAWCLAHTQGRSKDKGPGADRRVKTVVLGMVCDFSVLDKDAYMLLWVT